jgi:CHAT domain-containing protein
MTDDPHGCPSEETLGAFLEARLEGRERDAVVAHLATCDRCIGGADFVTRMRAPEAVSREEPQAVVVPIRPRSRIWLSIAATLAVIAAAAAVVQLVRVRMRPGIPTLIAATPADYRTIEPRLSGFPWAELQQLRDESPAQDPDTLRLGGAAGEILVRARNDSSPDAVHAAGVAELLLQRPAEAVERLKTAAENGGTAAVWNDLAAAYYAGAVRDGRSGDLPRALAAADRAIALDDALHEARFNRALILERMGLKSAAATAWRDYLAGDPSSPWAAEARRRANATPRTPATSTRLRMERLEPIAVAHDTANVDAIVRAAPQDARAWFETDVLGRWGEAAARGDAATAAPLLDAAREVAAALQRASGESLLADAVRAIDSADPPRRLDLARAHAAYRHARLLYRDRRLDEATAILLDAARAFDAAKSPMAGVARFFAACTLFDENRVDDAARLLGSIETAAHHDALRAQIDSRLATCHQYAGRWEEAVRGFSGARAAFDRLHENGNAAFAEANLGNVLDELGARDEAWRHRVGALGRYDGGLGLTATLGAAVRSELRAEEYASARALLAIEAEETAALDDPLLLADVLRRQALVDGQLGDERGAAESLGRCRALIGRARASGLRERLGIEVDVAEATLVRRHDPNRAIKLLASSTSFLARSDQRIALPDAFLAYGRALRTAGRDAEALAAFRAGLDEIEAQRRVSPAGSTIFDAVAPLVEETVALQLARGDAAAAFATAEQVHARALLDPSGTPPATAAEVASALPAGTMLISYALVPDGVAAIGVTRNGARAVSRPIGRRALAESIRALRAGIAARETLATVETRAAELHRLLLASVPGADAATALVVIPDRLLHAVPWAALYDRERGTFAVEQHALTIAPSAALYVRSLAATATTPHSPSTQSKVLVVTGASRNLDHLSEEASGYAGRLTLAGSDATASRFLSLAAESEIIHFAGHARVGADPALLLGDGSALRAAEIARARLVRPRLVVLAACGTAGGDGDGFDGPRGLARAFLSAGAGAVVGTLWPIDDAEAAALFSEFHRRIRAGEDAASALRHAQLALLRGNGTRSRHPAAWAAAELFGGNVTINGS